MLVLRVYQDAVIARRRRRVVAVAAGKPSAWGRHLALTSCCNLTTLSRRTRISSDNIDAFSRRRLISPKHRSTETVMIDFALFNRYSLVWRSDDFGGAVVSVVARYPNSHGFDVWGLGPGAPSSSCGLAAYFHLPSEAWRFEQLTAAISITDGLFTHRCNA